jgi:hypothetical protein
MKYAYLYHRVVQEGILIPIIIMSNELNQNFEAGLEEVNEPRLNGWHVNTDMCCDVKTILRSDRKMKVGKDYQGVLKLDSDAVVDEFLSRDPHYTFIETVPGSAGKRNPRVFDGRYITVTRREDGTLHPNFKNLPTDGGFKVERYALGVYNELCMALVGLVEEE